jgi:transposase
LTQVVLGLLVDPEGIPLGFEVYPGNTFEGETLKDIVIRLRHKFSVRRFIFVADRGLFSAAHLEHIRYECGEPDPSSPGGEFIVGMKRALFTPTSQTHWHRCVYSDFTVSQRWLREGVRA